MNFIFDYVWNGKKKQIVIEPPKEKVAMLTITMRNGTKHNWTHKPYKGTSIVRPWRNFWKWFYCRTSKYYNMQYDNGIMMLRRDEILSFHMEVINLKPPPIRRKYK